MFETMGMRVCANCGKFTSKKCGKCGCAKYCDSVCQKANWSVHKPLCIEPDKRVIYFTKKLLFSCVELGMFMSSVCHHVKLKQDEQLSISLTKIGQLYTAKAFIIKQWKGVSYHPTHYNVMTYLEKCEHGYEPCNAVLNTLLPELCAKIYSNYTEGYDGMLFDQLSTRDGTFSAVILSKGEGLKDLMWHPCMH